MVQNKIKEQKAVLQHVFADQRHLLQQYVNQDVTKVPQVFIPYKKLWIYMTQDLKFLKMYA